MPICRVFSSEAAAAEAAGALRQAGFGAGLHVVSGAADAAAIGRLGIAPGSAKIFAGQIATGAALVVAEAPFGTAWRATAILQGVPGGAAGAAATSVTAHGGLPRDPATPLSSAFQLPVLSHGPAPLSSFLRLATLSRRQNPQTSRFGGALLSRNAAPLSSLFRMATRARHAAPLSALFGMRVGWGKAAPLSQRLGMAVLTHNPAPLSARLNLPVLSRRRATGH